MKRLIAYSTICVGLTGLAVYGLAIRTEAQETPITGTVASVWEDGFRLDTGDRAVVVDSWNLCGDATESSVSEGDRLTLTGEFDGREFDASSITNAENTSVCRSGDRLETANDPAVNIHAQGSSFAGTVTRVWEDGFRLDTGDRTIVVDTWSLCGDATESSVSEGDRLTLTGEFDGREFDAFSMTNAAGTAICRSGDRSE